MRMKNMNYEFLMYNISLIDFFFNIIKILLNFILLVIILCSN